MTLIAELLAGAGLDLLLKGGAVAAKKIMAQEPAERMIWILYEEYGDRTGLERKEMLAWLTVPELGDAIYGTVRGNLIEKDRGLLEELLAAQLSKSSKDDPKQLAAVIADNMFRLVPWVNTTTEDGTVLLSHKMDEHFKAILKAVGSDGTDRPSSAGEALLRGPLAHVGMDSEADRARSLAENGDHQQAAEAFLEIVTALREADLDVVAETYLALAGELFSQAGLASRAVAAASDVAELQVARYAGGAEIAVQQLRTLLPEDEQWRADALGARLDFGVDMQGALEGLRVAHEKSVGNGLAATVHYTNLLVVAGKFEEILSVVDALGEEAFRRAPHELSLNHLDALSRLQKAGRDEAWTEFLERLEAEGKPETTGIAYQRRGSVLAFEGRVEECEEAYRQAISAFAQVPGYDEQAADALYSLQSASIMNAAGFPEPELRALAYAQRGDSDTPVARADALTMRGMNSRLSGKFPDALRQYTLALREHMLAGSLQGFLETSERLGELYGETGHKTPAMSSYIAAGKTKEAVEAARSAPSSEIEDVLRLSVSRWEKAAALAVIVEVGNRLRPAYLDEIAPAIIQEAEHDQGGWVAPQPAHQARLALSSILLGVSESNRKAVLELVQDSLASGRIDLLQPASRALQHATDVGLVDANDLLVDAFLDDPFNSAVSISFISDRLKDGSIPVTEVRDAAINGVTPALAALSLAELVRGDTELESASNTAATALSEAVNVKRTATEISVGQGRNFEVEAIASRFADEPQLLAAADRLLEIANDPEDTELNRHGVANGLFNLAGAIPEAHAAGVVLGLAPLARGEYPLSQWDQNIDDPFSRMRISLHTQAALWSAALGAIGRILHETSDLPRDALAEAVSIAYQRGPDVVVAAATDSLAQVPDIPMVVPVEVLLAHGDPSVRVAALRCWQARRDGLPDISALRSDSSIAVRHVLVLMAAERGRWTVVEAMSEDDEHALIRRVAELKLRART